MDGEASQDAPTAQSEKLFQHYQRPVKKGWPDDRERIRRYEWIMELLRLEIPLETLAVATALSMLGNADGSRMVPADPRFLNAVDLSYRQAVGTHLALLRDLKLLTLVQRAGGRTGVPAHVFHLSMPTDPSALPYRLDGDYERFEERPKGVAPIKAIEASKAARFSRKHASGQSRATQHHDRNPASGETPVGGTDDRKQASGENGTPTTLDQNSVSSETHPDTADEQKPASGQTPVDNPIDRKPASTETPVDEATDRNQASSENDFHRKRSTDSLEAQHTFTGSPASDSVVNPINATTHVVSKGGDLTTALDNATTQSESRPDDPYDVARTIVADVDPNDLNDLLSDAHAELVHEGNPAPDHRQILMRAADIATRTPRSHP